MMHQENFKLFDTKDSKLLRDYLREQFDIYDLVNSHFNNHEKTKQWLFSKIPFLGDLVPVELVYCGRGDIVKKTIKTNIDGNRP